VASFYHLCGKIHIDTDSKLFTVAKRAVILTEKNKGERRSQTDDKGEFCFEVKPGTYTVTPSVSAEEREKGLKLIPSEKSVTLEGTPILNLAFSQTKLSISGKVKCLEAEDKKCKDLKV